LLQFATASLQVHDFKKWKVIAEKSLQQISTEFIGVHRYKRRFERPAEEYENKAKNLKLF